MPIPVVIPGSPLPIDDTLTGVAEEFVRVLGQIMENGTSGGSPSLQTPAFLVPAKTDPVGSSVPLVINTKELQLMLRQTGLALAQMLRDTPTEFNRTADSGGVSAGTGVYYSSNDKVESGSSVSALTSGIIGVAPLAFAASASGVVVSMGVVVGILSSAVAGAPYYLGHGGTPVLFSSLVGGDQIVLLGYAKNSTDLDVNIQRGGVV